MPDRPAYKSDRPAYKLLVSDVDGTLVDSKQELVEANRKAVRRLHEEGLLFTLASGRKFSSVEGFVRELGIAVPLLLYNGARVISPSGEVLREKKLSSALIREALEFNEDYQLDTLVYHRDGIYVKEINHVIEEFQRKDGVECTAVRDLQIFLEKDVTKLHFIGEHDRITSFIREFKAVNSRASLVNSEYNYLEIMPPGVSKGEALLELAGLLELDMKEIVAVGDNLNDLEMIEKAGLGAATANAHPRLIQAADYVTGRNNEEGSVAEVIEEIMLGKNG